MDADAETERARVVPRAHAVVGYTDLSSQMDSTAVSNMLERLFKQFDEIAREHKVFKVVRGATSRT